MTVGQSAMQGEYIENHPLARYTSWRVGGCAERFYRPKDLADLQLFLKNLPSDEPLTFLGLGSNVLIRDGGIKGTVILTLNRLNEIHLLDETHVFAQVGVTSAKLSKFCIKSNLAGGAFFAGIPGTIGGALYMNAGAYGGETWPCVESVLMLQRNGDLVERTAKDFDIAYRQAKPHYPFEFFAGATFCFAKGDGEKAKQELKALLKKRNASQPIGSLSCGSVFKNPEGDFAARLIESCGLKGCRLGGAIVSQKHANFILNDEGATALDIERLIAHVHKTVLEQTGVDLQREYVILGSG